MIRIAPLRANSARNMGRRRREGEVYSRPEYFEVVLSSKLYRKTVPDRVLGNPKVSERNKNGIETGALYTICADQ